MVVIGQLANRGGLTDAVHTYYQDHGGPGGDAHPLSVVVEQVRHRLFQERQYFLSILDCPVLGRCADGPDQFVRSLDAHISGQKDHLQLVQEIIIDRGA